MNLRVTYNRSPHPLIGSSWPAPVTDRGSGWGLSMCMCQLNYAGPWGVNACTAPNYHCSSRDHRLKYFTFMMRVACNCNYIMYMFHILSSSVSWPHSQAPPCACGDEKYGVCRGRSLGTRLVTIHLDHL